MPHKPRYSTLENVEYLGIGDSSCYGSSCTATLKFQSGKNVYQLTGHKHEMKNLVVGSHYNIQYSNFSKEIENYDFAIAP